MSRIALYNGDQMWTFADFDDETSKRVSEEAIATAAPGVYDIFVTMDGKSSRLVAWTDPLTRQERLVRDELGRFRSADGLLYFGSLVKSAQDKTV